jgi:DNA-binding HxlR family transcriptional regulator
VPAEAFAFRTLIQAIAEGAITPDKLDEALRVHVPTETNRSLSPSFLTSQRSGALSRMADLGLIARKRKGVRVSYTITPAGEALVREGKA